jgi:serine/threonine protein kinase
MSLHSRSSTPETIAPAQSHNGTPAFLAPELLAEDCDPAAVDPKAADVWALGVTLYVMLFGHLPWPMLDAASYFDRVLHEALAFDDDVDTYYESNASGTDATSPSEEPAQVRPAASPSSRNGADTVPPALTPLPAFVVEPVTPTALPDHVVGSPGADGLSFSHVSGVGNESLVRSGSFLSGTMNGALARSGSFCESTSAAVARMWRELLNRMLRKDPVRRVTIAGVRAHMKRIEKLMAVEAEMVNDADVDGAFTTTVTRTHIGGGINGYPSLSRPPSPSLPPSPKN